MVFKKKVRYVKSSLFEGSLTKESSGDIWKGTFESSEQVKDIIRHMKLYIIDIKKYMGLKEGHECEKIKSSNGSKEESSLSVIEEFLECKWGIKRCSTRRWVMQGIISLRP